MAGLFALPAADAQVKRRDHRDPAASPQVTVRGMAPQTGAPGTEVTIRGNFPGDAEVWLNRRKVQADVQPRRIKFTVPRARPGAVFSVVVRAGGADVSAGDFTIEGLAATPPPPPAPPPPAAEPVPMPPPRPGMPGRHGAPIVTDYYPRQGPPGTTITVEGRRLHKDLQLVYGGQPVEIKNARNRSLQFDIPRGAASGLIVLKRRRRDIVVGRFEVVKQRVVVVDRRKLWNQRRTAAERRWRQREAKLARDAAAREAELRRQEEELRRQREERRRKHLAALRAKWEAQFLGHPEVRAEMALHAERSARLQRMLRLAEAGAHGKLAVRIYVLIESEDARHEQRMKDLRAALARR
jgi:hypothetical protein